MRIGLLATWHRRCGSAHYERAFRQLGHDVTTIGHWKEEEPFGTRDRKPHVMVYRPGAEFTWDELRTYLVGSTFPPCDALFVLDGGEGLRLTGEPYLPWVHHSTEGGAQMAWSKGLTPHRFAEIMCNGQDDGVRWMPKAFDAEEHTWAVEDWRRKGLPAPILARIDTPREYDLVQFASARDARRHVWRHVTANAPDLHCVFGDIWGPLYATAYQHALATYVCSTLDFVTTRVFEAMAMGAVVIADRTPSIAQLFTEGEHFIGFDPIPGAGGEGMPDPDWLIETVRRLRAEGDGGMARRAYDLVSTRDSYAHRAQAMLQEVFA